MAACEFEMESGVQLRRPTLLKLDFVKHEASSATMAGPKQGANNGMSNGMDTTLLRVDVCDDVSNNKIEIDSFTKLDLGFSDISYSVNNGLFTKNKKCILNKVSGEFLSGDLTAVMGPSGAGKSTLMDILSGYIHIGVNGYVTINGTKRNLQKFRLASCYIMQDDKLHPLLTVNEAMHIGASLKLGSEISKKERKSKIDIIVAAMGLKNALNTETVKLSGGQRKRLAIALELIKNPPIMFFDEPTSGLDSSTSKQCIALLKKLAQEGRTIVCNIHQPSAMIFEMFDHLYTLTEGQCVYQGSVKGLLPFLSELNLKCPPYHNPADYVMEVSLGQHGDHLDALVNKSENGKSSDWRKKQNSRSTLQSFSLNHVDKMMADGLVTPVCAPTMLGNPLEIKIKPALPQPDLASIDESKVMEQCCQDDVPYPTTFFKQFSILLKRTFLILSRDRILTYLRLSIHLAIALFIGFLYYRIGEDATYMLDNFNFLFFSIMFLMFTAFSSMTLTFPLEIPIITREYFNGWYSVKSYYLAVIIADIPIQVASVLIYVVITFHLTAQPYEIFRFSLFLGMCLLVSLIAQSIGVLCGSFMDVKNVVVFGPFFILPFLIFSGFFIHLSDAHPSMQWLFHTSFLKHAFEGVMISIFGYDRPKMPCSSDYCHFSSPSKFLDQVDMEHATYSHAVIVLVFLFFVTRIGTYFILLYRLRYNRNVLATFQYQMQNLYQRLM